MTMNNFVRIACIALIFSAQVNASQQLSADTAASQNSDIEILPSPGIQISEKIDGWYSKRGIVKGYRTKSGKTYYDGSATVLLSPSDKNYPKALQQAFDKAFDNARAAFVYDRVGQQISDKESESYENGSSNNKDFNPEMCRVSKLESIWNKVVALTDAKLDEALRENGVDPEEFKSTPRTAQKELFYEKTIEKNTRTAFGEIIGLLPVQTFVATSEKGTSKVGVIMVHAPKLMSLVNSLKEGSKPTFSSKRGGKPLSFFVNKTADDLESVFGPRLAFDENSQPIILAYGQWAASYKGNNERRKERSRDLAFEKADMQATQLIGEFLNGKLESRSEQVTGSITRIYLETDCKTQREKEENTLIDEMSKYMRITGNSKAKGSTVIKRWAKTNEYGIETLGVVRLYSFELFNQHTKSLQKNANTQKIKSSVKESVEDVDPEEDW